MLPSHTSPHLDAWRLPAPVAADHGLPVLATVDVVVVGAGAAGVAAATTAAEHGASVLLVEKYGFAGGAAVAGMSGTICGLYLAHDEPVDAPTQIVHGFAERFRAALEAVGGLTAPQRYGKTFTVAHDPLMWREIADHMLTFSGVRTLFHTTVSRVIAEEGRCLGVVLQSTAGEAAVHASRVIDASGDAVVVSQLGGEYHFGDEGRIQNPTMFFRLGGVDTDAFWDDFGDDTICPTWVTERLRARRAAGDDLPREKIWVFRTPRPGELMVNATRLAAPDGRVLNVVDPEDFTIAEILGRRQVRAYEQFLRSELAGCADGFVVDTGVEVGIRQTRSIRSTNDLTNDDVVNRRKRSDGICRSPWPIELHDGQRPRLHWLLDDYYDVPLGALIPEKGENVMVAGRCLGADHEALASARVTAQCFEYGAAAAFTTLHSLDAGIPLREVSADAVRRSMTTAGSTFDHAR
jgi:hypothetical protein